MHMAMQRNLWGLHCHVAHDLYTKDHIDIKLVCNRKLCLELLSVQGEILLHSIQIYTDVCLPVCDVK